MIVALDYGEKKTGFAYSDETETFAFSGHLISEYKNLDGLKLKLEPVLEQFAPKTIVIGDPTYKGPNRNMESINELVVHFKERDINVVLINEFYTSETAKVNLKGTKNPNIDSESARQILQEYLDSLKK
jgi:RNase H-fold protein (predicted Holliday junction resolvase)